MKTLIIITALMQGCTGCGIQKAMDNISSQMQTVGGSISSVSDSMKETNEGIKYTKDAIRKQTLAVALKELISPENNTFVSPGNTLPVSQFPSGKLFGEIATPEEVAGIFYLWAIEVNQGQIDPPSPENKKKSDQLKWIKLIAMQTIAGFLDEKKLKEIVATQKDGIYAESVNLILLFRHCFISSYILEAGVLAAKEINQSEYEYGVQAINSLRSIEAIRGIKEFKFVIVGFNDNEGLGLNQTVQIDPKLSASYAERLSKIPRH